MRSGTQSLERSLAILDQFDEQHRRLSLAEVAKQLDVSSVTAYRYVRAFVNSGLLVYENGEVRLSEKFVRLSELYLSDNHLIQAALGPIRQVYHSTQETVALCELRGIHVTCIHRIESQSPLRTSFAIGEAMPIYAGSFARALAAFLPPSTLDAIVSRTSWRPFTASTIADPPQFYQRIEQIRQHGYDVSIEEVNMGVVALAVPLRWPPHLVASLGMSAPLVRYDPAHLQQLLDPLFEAQTAIEAELRNLSQF